MACSKQSAKDYIANARVYLVGELRNLSVILENLYQQKVLTDEEVSKIKAEKDDYDRTKAILDSVTRKGEAACYRFLRIIDQTRRTLERPTPIFKISHETSTEATKFDLHHWISCFSFTEDPETDQNYIQESRPCYRYQAKLKSKAEKISKDFWKRSENLFAEKKKPELLYTSLILDIQGKNFPTRINRFKRDMCRPKKLRTEISPSDLLKADKNILLVGKPGIGKTALSHEILRLWSERDSKELDYMFYFDMRELTNISPITSLEDLLFTACSEPDKGKDEVLHDIKSNSDNVTVILDGVTDFSTSVVKKLVDKDFLPDAKIIITCRPNDGKDLCPEDWLRVEVKGFSEETIKTYLSSTLGEAHRKVFRNVELLTLCHVPMYALMVAASFSSKDSLQPRTVTEIYINIVRFGLQMNSNKTRIRNLNQFIKTKRNGILSLAEAAFNATERKTVNLGELSCEDSCVLSFLKTLDVKVSPTETKTLYAFLHYTMQDFFAALWLLENPDNIREVFQQCLTEEKKHMKHLIPFMCRLLNDKSPRLMSCLIPAEEIKETSGWFFTEIIDTFFHQAVANISELHVDTLFVYQCLFESQSSEVCISFLAKLDFHLDLSGANLDPYSCCAVAYVVTQSKERKISLNLQDVTITAQGMRHLFGCLQNVEWYDTLKQQLWKIFLLSEEQMDYQTLLGLSGNLLHLPVVGKKKLFDRAVKVLQTIATKVNVCLYGDRKDPLCPILRNSLLETLPCINSLRMTYRSAGSMNQEECNNTMEKDQKNMFLDLCFTTALYSKQKFYSAMPELVRVCQVKTDLVNTLVDLHQHAISRGLSTDFPTLRPVFQSTPADWLIDLSERKASTLLEMLKLQSEKKKVELTGFSHDKSEMRNLLQCLPYLSKLSFVTEPTESSESIWFLEKLICAAAEMKEQNGVNMLELLSVCTYRGTPLQWKWCDFLLDLYSSKTETGPTFSSFTSVLQSADPAIWFVKLSKTKASMLLDVLKLQSGKKQVNLTGCSHEEAEVRSFLHCLPYISRLSVVPLWSSSVEQTRFLTRLFCAAAEREKQTGEKILEMLASVCRYEHFPFNNRSIDETYRRNFLLDLYSQMNDCETETGLSLLPSIQSVFQSAPEIWTLDLSKIKTSILLEVMKLQPEKKQVKVTNWSYEEHEVRNLIKCLPYISKFRFVPESSKLHEQTSFLVTLYCAAAEREQQTGEKMLDRLASVCTFKIIPVSDTDMNEQAQKVFLLSLYSQVTDYESKTGLSLFPLLKSVFQSVANVWITDLSERNTLMLRELLIQSEKKQVVLKGCSHEESEVKSFLECLPFFSQLSFEPWVSEASEEIQFLRSLFCAAEKDEQKEMKTLDMLASVYIYREAPLKQKWSEFLLELFSYELKTGLSVPPLQRANVILFKVLKLKSSRTHGPRIAPGSSDLQEQRRFLVNLFCAAAEREQQTGEKMVEMLAPLCRYKTFPFKAGDKYRVDFLLDLYSQVKDRETKSGLSLLPSLQSVFQSAPKLWTIKFSKRKTSDFMEVMKLQAEKKRVELTDCSYEESEVRSFLQCLPFISQLSFNLDDWDDSSFDPDKQSRFLVNLFCAAAEREQQTGEKMLERFASVCRYKTFPFHDIHADDEDRSDFLLDLYSQMKDRETKSGLSLLPSLQSVFQSAPKVWFINLSKRKTSILLEVMKLQPEKKIVKLTDCSHGESEVRSFLQCLPFISQLSFDPRSSDLHEQTRFLVNLFCAAAEREQQTGEKMLEMLASVCRYKTFPLDDRCMANFEYGYRKSQSDFLLDLYSQMKDRETKSGLSLLPSLQSVFQSFPFFWTIKLSERKTSILLEVMKLQPEKKPVMLTDCSHGESEVRSFLQCLPFISQLRCMPRFFQSVCSSLSVRSREEIQQLVSLLQLLNFNLFLTGELNDKTCSSVGKVLPLVGSKVDLILTDSRMSVRGAAVLFRSTTQLHSLRLSNSLVLFFSQWVRRGRVAFPLVLEELTVVSTKAQPQRVLLKVGSSLASLLRFWTVGRLDLTESGLPVQSLFSLLLHDGPLTLRLSEERLQQLLVLLHEVQDQDRTLSLLNKVGGDLSSCQLSWELLHFLLQQPTGQTITVNLKKNRFLEERAAELLPFLHRMVIQRLSPSFVRTSIREIFRTHPSHMISWLLRSLDLVINLNCTELDSKDCDALLFILRHSDGVKLKLLWSSIPAEGIQSILSMLHTVSDLSVDRNLLLRFIHCCAASDSQQGAASGLLRTLRHRLDLSCSSCVELPEEDQTEPLRLTAADCWAVSTVLRRSSRDTQLDLRDCEVEDSGLDLLFPVLDGVRLRVNKTVPVQLLSLLAANNQGDAVRRATSLCRALGGELDLSHRPLDQRLCGALALMLDYSEDLTELDLSHCQLTDQLLLQLITHLHKVHNLDLSHNQITDASTGWLLHLVAINPFIVSVSLNNNNIINKTPFKDNRKFEIS
uniref:Si:ch211-108d22.2 n=1 Tax=Xiphophorus maculatus TaxID=8083 RepID=A0A3B5QF82_XIPMA